MRILEFFTPKPSPWGEIHHPQPRPLPHQGELVSFRSETRLCVLNYVVRLREGKYLLLKRIYKGDPDRPPQDGRPAVLFLPGYAENGNVFRLTQNGQIRDISEINCAANLLAQQGEDVFIAHLWGGRINERYGRKNYGEEFTYLETAELSFDHLVQWDLPSIVEKVRTIIGPEATLHLVGHSLGGTIAYAYQGLVRDPGIASLTAIASPVHMDTETPITEFFLAVNWLASSLGAMEQSPLLPVFDAIDGIGRTLSYAPYPLASRLPVTGFVYSSDVNREVASGFFRRVMETVSPLVTMFLAQMMVTGEFESLSKNSPEELLFWLNRRTSAPLIARLLEVCRFLGAFKEITYDQDGLERVDYAQAMRGIELPLLLLDGTEDTLVPAHCSTPAMGLVSSREKFRRTIQGSNHLGVVAGRDWRSTWQTVADFHRQTAG